MHRKQLRIDGVADHVRWWQDGALLSGEMAAILGVGCWDSR